MLLTYAAMPRRFEVLVVEDDDDVREALLFLLEDEGVHAVGATDGRDALEKIENGLRPALILLDLMMPVMDGWAFRAAQLADPRLAQIPVVILSAATDVDRHAAQLRVDEYLVKPLDMPLLLDAVERHL